MNLSPVWMLPARHRSGDNGNVTDVKGKFPNGLAAAMSEKGIGPTELARLATTSKQNVQRWAKQIRKLPIDWAEKLAPILGTSPERLVFGDGPTSSPQRTIEAPLISWVSAGGLTEPDYVESFEDAPKALQPGLDLKGRWIALKVDGDSMDRISPPDSIIFVNLRDRRKVSNACYVIKDADGNATYKRFRTGPARWEPVSMAADKHPTLFEETDGEPKIIGRVRRTVLDL